MEGLGVAASIIAVVDLSAKIASLCLQYTKDVKHAKDDITRLCRQVIELGNTLHSLQQLLDSPDGARLKASRRLVVAIQDSRSLLRDLHATLCPKTARQAISRLGFRFLKWPFQSKDVDKIVEDLGQCMQIISLVLQVDQTTILLDVDKKMMLDRLPIAGGASFDSHAQEHDPTCLPNTRVDLLRQVTDWAENPRAKSIFWLNGMAGMGKTTISRTLAQKFADKGYLRASFFFKRGEADRGSLAKFFTTIAADLVVRESAIACYVKDAIDSDPFIIMKNAQEQFDKLVLQPLSKITIGGRKDEPAVIIVDALDECECEDDIKLLIRLFSLTKDVQSNRLRIFMTSRPELPLRLGFKAIEGIYQDLILHEIPEPVIEHDISAFLKHELVRVRLEYNASVADDRQFPTDWPSESHIRSLAKMAVPLFIFAATICRFIADRKYGNPEKQLMKVLSCRTTSYGSTLAQTYLLVLNEQIAGLNQLEQNEVLREFRDIIGPIVILATPLSTSALAKLLSISKLDIDNRLDLLHSVLNVPQSTGSPIRLLHSSFRDFLMNSNNRKHNPFWIPKQQTHEMVGANCLRILDCLKQDLCDVKSPGTPRAAISPETISACLPPEVQYACLYWVYHIQQARTHIADSEPVHIFLICHFLHWVEALSLMGRASESLSFIKTLQTLLKPQNSKQLSGFLDDATRFLFGNISAIDSVPLQIYSSLLVFAPKRSKVRSTFEGENLHWICLQPRVESDWGQYYQTLEGHGGPVRSVAFSHDSIFVASASEDKTIRLSRADSGECIKTLEGHSGPVWSVAFSHDSMFVASASEDKTIRLWCADSGECIKTLEGHSGPVWSVAFSHDSIFVASASKDKTIRLWHANSGECIQTLEGHSGWVWSVAFSHNSALVASASVDNTIHLWRTISGECIHVFKGHSSSVCSVAFSHDSALVVSASSDKTIRLWHIDSGECIQTLEGHSGPIWSVAFSHDSIYVASASDDKTLRLWRVDSGECIQMLKGHSGWVWSVAFSHNSAFVASASNDKTIRIWRADSSEYIQTLEGHSASVRLVACSRNSALISSTSYDGSIRLWCVDSGECSQSLEGHSGSVRSIAFSHDSALVASASDDKTIRLWRVDSGECIQILKGHSGWVWSVAFSHDSALVASASDDKTIRLWRVSSGECIQILEGHSGSIYSVAFSHNSAYVASASDDKTIRIWRVTSDKCIWTLQGHSNSVWSVAFSNNLAMVASASGDKTVRLWNIDSGECIRIFEGHTGLVQLATFSHDSTLVASASSDKTIRLWRTDSGECIQIVDLGITSSHVSFEAGSFRLLTDVGAVSVCSRALTSASTHSGSAERHISRTGYGISRDRCWITWKEDNLLWLPVEFRPSCSTVLGSTIILGCASGKVYVIRFLFNYPT